MPRPQTTGGPSVRYEISVPRGIADAVERFAAEHGVSRSRVFWESVAKRLKIPESAWGLGEPGRPPKSTVSARPRKSRKKSG